jgi:glycosyltransferase involved in cell wall biosynthesis
VPENSIDVFLNAAEKILELIPIVIVGNAFSDAIFPSKILDLANRNSNLKWVGHISDDEYLKSLWQNCTMYFHGHTVGGTNPALVQAMASGSPIIAIDTPFSREVLGDSGIFSQR